MKTLKRRRLDIASGNTDLPLNTVLLHRERWASQGYTLPPFDHPLPDKTARGLLGVGTILARKLSWFSLISGSSKGCSACKTKQNELDNRSLSEFTEETILKDAKEISNRRSGLAFLTPAIISEWTIARNIREAVKEHTQALVAKKPKRNAASKRKASVARPNLLFTPVVSPLPRGDYSYTWGSFMTVAKRKQESYSRALDGAYIAGFQPWVFAEPDTQGSGPRWIQRPEVVASPVWGDVQGVYGAHANYVQSCADVLVAEPDADMFLYLQDDAYPVKALKEFLNTVDFTNIPLLSLWCPSGHNYMSDTPGIAKTPKAKIIGAVSYVMPRKTLELLATSKFMRNWQKNKSLKDRRTFDMATGECLASVGLRAKYLTYSLVDHFEPVRSNSSINNGAVQGFRVSHKYIGDAASIAEVNHFYPLSQKILVVIPGINLPEKTLRCIEAVKDSSVPSRICYIDNASTPSSLQRVKSSLRPTDMCILNSSNEGFTYAVQQGINARTSEEHVLVLNNDCYVQKDCIEKLLLRLQDPFVAAVNPLTNDNGACSVKRSTNQSLQRNCAHRELNTLPFFCTLLHRNALRKYNKLPMNPAVRSGLGVDDHWCRKVRSTGWKCVLDGSAFAEHDHYSTFDDTKQDREALQKVAMQWLKNRR